MGEFLEQLQVKVSQGDMCGANSVIMKELGHIVVHHRPDFIDLMNNSDNKAHIGLADAELIKMYFDNIHKKEMLIGTAFLVNSHNKVAGFDGEPEVSNDGVIKTYKTLHGYLGVPPSAQQVEDSEFDWYRQNKGIHNKPMEETSGFIYDTIAKGIKGASGRVLDAQHQKKYGALENLQAQQKAKSDLAASVMAERQAQIAAAAKEKEEKAKITKMLLIGGGTLVAIGLGVVLYLKFKHK